MTDRTVFLSYSHKSNADEVIDLVGWLEDTCCLPIWFDSYLNDGNFNNEIEANLKRSVGMILLLSEQAAGEEPSSYIMTEIDLARQFGITVTIVQIGDFEIDTGFRHRIVNDHRIKVTSIAELRQNPFFLARIDCFREWVQGNTSATPEQFVRKHLHGSTQSKDPLFVEDWYDRKRSVSEQALALAVATLVDAPIELTMTAAGMLDAKLEGELREMTEAEKEGTPRVIGHSSRDQRLSAVRAERVLVFDPFRKRKVEIIRFTDPD